MNTEKRLKKEQLTKDINERLLEDVKKVLALPSGCRVLWWLLSLCHVYQKSFTGNSETFYKDGERNIGIQLIAKIMETDETAYAKLQLEIAKDKLLSEYKNLLKEE